MPLCDGSHAGTGMKPKIVRVPDGASVELTVPPRTKKALQRPADAEEGSEGGSGSGQQ